MIDVVVCEAVIGGSGLCVPWQHCFSFGSIVAGGCFGRLGPQPIMLLSFISFVNSYLSQDFSGILQNEADVLTHYI
jgi:hypothetical protein